MRYVERDARNPGTNVSWPSSGIRAPRFTAWLTGRKTPRSCPSFTKGIASSSPCIRARARLSWRASRPIWSSSTRSASFWSNWSRRDGETTGESIFGSCLPLAELRRRFRQYTMVELPDGETAYFRFYDPRVFRVFIPTCNASECQSIFAGIKAFYADGSDGSSMLRFRLKSAGQVSIETLFDAGDLQEG